MLFEDLLKTLDPDIWVEIYSNIGDMVHRGRLRDLRNYPDRVMRIIPQSTSREVYLEIQVS